MDWATSIWTENNYVINDFSLQVNWLGDTQKRWKQQGTQVECSEDARSLTCKGQSIPAFEGDDNIMWRDHIGKVALGGLDNWQEVSERTAVYMQKAKDNIEGLDGLVSDLTAELSDQSDKINAILDFVARDIRYISMSETGHAVTPHTIGHTIKNRYGDCKDKSTLLLAMLNKIGIEGKLRLVATKRAYPSTLLLPSMTAFDHIVACFTLGRQEYCLDPTDNTTNWQVTPNWIQGKVSLPVDPEYIPHRMPISAHRWQMKNKAASLFDEKGGQYERQTREYSGEYAAYYRSYLMTRNDKEKHEYLVDEYTDAVTSLSEPEFLWSGVDDMDFKLKIISENTLPAFLDIDQPLVYTENDAWIKKELKDMRLQNKDFDEYFSGIKLESEYEYDLNDLWRLKILPPTLSLNHHFGSLIRETEQKGEGKLKVTTTLDIAAQWVAAEDIVSFNEFLTVLEGESSIHFQGELIQEK
ncbi:transglutaminase-like domain-containing protein [Veronia nyctiphanis]